MKLTRRDTDSSTGIYKLSISDLRLWVHLGCSREEMHNPQSVSFDILFSFLTCPDMAESDSIDDGLCYGFVVEYIEKEITRNKYKTIEYLASKTHSLIKSLLVKKKNLSNIKISVKVTKLHIPVKNIFGDVSFTYCE